MKTLLLLLIYMLAAARGAIAQETQCDRERAAMVETIRVYARSYVNVLGQQGLSERVLGANTAPSVRPRAILLHRVRRRAAFDRPRPDHIAAVHRSLDD